jgi:hypothetical protein
MKYLTTIYSWDSKRVVEAKGKWPKTRDEALEESITKWEWLVNWIETNPDDDPPQTGEDSCALCHLYIKNDCNGCPVFEHTGAEYCEKTPYDSYADTTADAFPDRGKALRLARNEVKFLKSLRRND